MVLSSKLCLHNFASKILSLQFCLQNFVFIVFISFCKNFNDFSQSCFYSYDVSADEVTLGAVGENPDSIPAREDKFKPMEVDNSNNNNVMDQSNRHGSILFLN